MNESLENVIPRWEQRLSKLSEVLNWAVTLGDRNDDTISDIECQGWVQVFERCHDMAWTCLRDYLTWQGSPDHHGPRDVIRESISRGVLQDGERWMDLNAARSLALKSHHPAIARALCERILSDYLPLFLELRDTLQAREGT